LGKIKIVVSCFDNKGNSLNKGNFQNGNGTVREYNATGKLINRVNYENGYKSSKSISIDYDLDNSHDLNTKAWYIYENETGNEILMGAIKLIERSIELDENYYNTDTAAALHYKIGNTKMALRLVNKAIKIAKKNSTDFSSTTKLIKLFEK